MAIEPALEAVWRMERFVIAIVAGGIALVAGLWLVTLFEPFRAVWTVGAFLVVLGASALGAGIWSEVERER
jgi:type IV secretory pathway VirB2 component (pilin)